MTTLVIPNSLRKNSNIGLDSRSGGHGLGRIGVRASDASMTVTVKLCPYQAMRIEGDIGLLQAELR